MSLSQPRSMAAENVPESLIAQYDLTDDEVALAKEFMARVHSELV